MRGSGALFAAMGVALFGASQALGAGGTIEPGGIFECYSRASILLRDMHAASNPAEVYGSDDAGGALLRDRILASHDPAEPSLSDASLSGGVLSIERDGKRYQLSRGATQVVVYNLDSEGRPTGNPANSRYIPTEVRNALVTDIRARFRRVWGIFSALDGTDPMSGEATITVDIDGRCTALSLPKYTESQRRYAARQLEEFARSCRADLNGNYRAYLGTLASGGCGVNFSPINQSALADIAAVLRTHSVVAGAAAGAGATSSKADEGTRARH